MERKRKKWSEEEISRLREIMTRYTVDVKGCKYAAQELGRSYYGIVNKWNEIKPNKRTHAKTKDIAEILYKNISNSPGNIQAAIRTTAGQVKKSPSQVEHIYYSKKSPYHHSKTSTCLTLISKNKMSSNYKNFNDSKKTTKQRIKLFIANILGIKKEDL